MTDTAFRLVASTLCAGLALGGVSSSSGARAPGYSSAPRVATLTLADRVKCQEALDRVRYSHQIGATLPFEEALPRESLERNVVTYLRQTAALSELWDTPVTRVMLEREIERLLNRSRRQDRLQEMFAALGNDPFLIQECLARPLLVDRLSRNFYAFDARFHAGVRAEAERARTDVLRLGLAALVDRDPRWSTREMVESTVSGKDGAATKSVRSAIELAPDEYRRRRTQLPNVVGEVGPVEEEREAFVIRVVTEEAPRRMRVATLAIHKTTWDEWWAERAPAFDPDSVASVAGTDSRLPKREARTSAACLPDDTWNNGMLDDLPEPHEGYTAIWTGTEMVVWGGLQNTTSDRGGRYDPATDTWRPMATAGAPPGRSAHTAIWTGTEMIVWGGVSGFGPRLNTGGRYDPASDTWSPTTTSGAPSGRAWHTAIWTGSDMIVWGGLEGDRLYPDTGGRYDPVANTWTPTSTVGTPGGRASHTAIWTGSEMIVWGGTGNGLPFATGGRYAPASNSWTPISSTELTARTGHTAVWTGTSMIVWGGLNSVSYENTGGRYDPTSDTWTPVSTDGAPSARTSQTAIWTGEEMIAWGGSGGNGVLDSGGRYRPESDSWSPTSQVNAPSARANHIAVWTSTVMIVWSGAGGNNTGGRYDPAADSWTPTSTLGMPTARTNPTTVWTGTQMVIWGGFYGEALNTGSRYEPATDTWSPTSTIGAPAGVHLHTAVWSGQAMIV